MVGTMVSLYALIQYSLHFPLPWKYNFKGGVFSTLGNPNRLAGYLILILPFCLDSLYREKRVKVKVGLLVILLILLGGLLLTRTEGAFLATLISILMFLFLVNRKKFSRWNRANKLILLLFIVTFVFTVIPLIFKSLPEYSINWRLFIWKTSLSMVKEKPFFGWGIGGLERNYPLFQQATRLSMKEASSPFTQETHAHNDYLQILVENGVVGLGLFLGIFVAFFREQLFCKRENLDIPLVCSITAFLTFSLTSFPLYMVNPALVLWVFLGMHSSQMGSSKGYIQLSINLSRNIWRFICSSFIIIAGIFIFFATRLVYADYLYHMGNLYAERGMYSLAESYYKKSLSFNPEEAQIYYSLGKLSFEQGRILDSQRMFETALRLGLNHEKIHLGLASTYKKMGLDEKAKWHYLKAKSLKGEL
ncbi:MAG TPA: hypothetical protein EYP78_01105 [Candidatus Omnitrophica bacterium]|nr:hypothetical protein [Candidatus Omnitrophota bacterium]